MMDFNERLIPGVSANYLVKEVESRYLFASRLIKSGMKILDLGCGTGYGTSKLARGKRIVIVGLDNNKEAIEYAKQHYGNRIKFILGDATNLKYGDQSIDFVCAFELIEHLQKPTRFLKEVYRVLKKGELLVLSTPNKTVFSKGENPKSSYHIKEYDISELRKLLKSVFPKVEIRGQEKTRKAKEAFSKFMDSQEARQFFVDKDIFNIRMLVPRKLKEIIWKYLGSFFGREEQERLDAKDFPVVKKGLKDCEYFIAICRK